MPTQRAKTGVKGIITVVVLLVLTAAAILLQIRYRGFEGPLSNNLLILILTNANILLLAAVVFMIARSLWKLSVERRSKVLGAKFRTKLVAAFVGLSFIPTILLFIFGSGMYTRGIERLFSLRLEVALRDSVALSRSYYDRLEAQALGFARQISMQLAAEGGPTVVDGTRLRELIEKKTAEYGIGAAAVFGTDSSLLAQVVTGQYPDRTYTRAASDLINKALSRKETSAVVNLTRTGDLVRAVVPVVAPQDGAVLGAVAVSYYVPESHTRRIDEIRAAYSEYRSSFEKKSVLKLSYRLGFLAVMLALLLAAIWVALRVAASITVPIRKLAEGTVEVAAGNLDYRIEENEQAGDEVGMLVGSFNRMTSDLKHSNERLRQEMSNKETILANIDAGVISLDRSGRITTMNPAALHILDVRPEDVLHRRYDEAFRFVDLRPIRNLFRRLEDGPGRAEEVITLTMRGRTLTLRLRVSTLRDEQGALLGSVIAFDDLTELLRAKNAETWQDVARKIAHEVKNPLTPIKLSAERLRRKFVEKAPDFEPAFESSSLVIIQEVERLKRLLDEFSDFARMPRPNPVVHPLRPIVDSGIALFVGTNRAVDFATDIPEDLPDLLLDPEQMKLVFINLLKNAIEVMDEGGTITITARTLEDSGTVRIDVADNGPGIPAEDLSRLFEPYFTRKSKGGGLGLAIVERIIADHRGSIRVELNQPRGARFIIELPMAGARDHDHGLPAGAKEST